LCEDGKRRKDIQLVLAGEKKAGKGSRGSGRIVRPQRMGGQRTHLKKELTRIGFEEGKKRTSCGDKRVTKTFTQRVELRDFSTTQKGGVLRNSNIKVMSLAGKTRRERGELPSSLVPEVNIWSTIFESFFFCKEGGENNAVSPAKKNKMCEPAGKRQKRDYS